MTPNYYYLRPGCRGRKASLVMLQGMDVDEKHVDESRILPLLDMSSFEISQVAVWNILEFVFYKEGDRHSPLDMVFGATIFDEAPSHIEADAPARCSLPPASDFV
ncbi:hypothetical protein PHMEG_00027944 [Phytophthora megakarya]|uniref:Uncharacterized protein n=1 Tax=Phytophthora megakarya TaxID=4795 RepID=A0A225V5P6_9STRA|nr:hypothetical protein PHMEG_00027944 [Phytophthora megakarya]